MKQAGWAVGYPETQGSLVLRVRMLTLPEKQSDVDTSRAATEHETVPTDVPLGWGYQTSNRGSSYKM